MKIQYNILDLHIDFFELEASIEFGIIKEIELINCLKEIKEIKNKHKIILNFQQKLTIRKINKKLKEIKNV